jgi:hypothetical protein
VRPVLGAAAHPLHGGRATPLSAGEVDRAYRRRLISEADVAAVLAAAGRVYRRNRDLRERTVSAGPYETERQAADAVRHIIDSRVESWTDGCHRLMEDA